MKYSNYSDKELLLEYKNNNDEYALNILIERFHSLIAKCAAPLYIVGADREDLIQEGRIGLLEAIKGYDEAKNDSFIPFAKLCIQRSQIKAVEAQNRKKHLPLNNSMPLDYDENEVNTTFPDIKVSSPEDIMIDIIKTGEILDGIEDTLSHKEMEVLLYLIEGYNYRQIAKMLGCELKSIDNAMQRIKKKVHSIVNSIH